MTQPSADEHNFSQRVDSLEEIVQWHDEAFRLSILSALKHGRANRAAVGLEG